MRHSALLFSFGALAVGSLGIAKAQLVTDFEAYANGAEVMFRQPGFSGTTGAKVDGATDTAGVMDNPLADPNPDGGSKVYGLSWSFLSGQAPYWVRLTTFGTANVPNPTVSFGDTLSFDVYSDSDLYVALGLRETSTTADIGANGGSAGTIEFVGGSTDNTATPVKGRLVAANTWTTVTFDLTSEAVRAFTGNGILESTTGRGVLEHLVLTPFNEGDLTYTVLLDNFAVAPVPEPGVLLLSGLGVAALALRRRFSKR